MTARLASAVVPVALLLHVLPSQAQYAYTKVARPTEEMSSIDPEETPKVAAYKIVHGVVQGKQGALPGATVALHGSRTIVVTNSEGEFELRVPANAKTVKLTCGYGGLQEEVITLAPAQALGSIYLLRTTDQPAL
jgi:hypothetical protein